MINVTLAIWKECPNAIIQVAIVSWYIVAGMYGIWYIFNGLHNFS